jgi:protein-S-isoprenylcysteine O-methyltransferase Ste14
MKKNMMEALVKFSLGVVLVAALVFLPAGSLHFRKGWLLMAVLFLPMLVVGLVLIIRQPALLEQRLKNKESRQEQSLVVKLSGLMFVAGFVLAGLDFRFGWIVLPDWISYGAAVLFLLSYLLYAKVLRENPWLSRTVEVQDHQTVVDTGLYGIVRHPMYIATVLLFLSMPLILGSLVSFVVFLAYPVIIAKRIRDEEALLEAELEGYAAYRQKVRWRLVPFIW